MKKLVFLLIILFVWAIPFSLAKATFEPNTTITAESSNTSIFISNLTAYADSITVEAESIYLEGFSYSSGDMNITINTPINITTENTNYDINDFPRFTSSSSDIKKYISNDLAVPVNATVNFVVDNCNVESIRYDSQTGSYWTNYEVGSQPCSLVNTSYHLTLDIPIIDANSTSNIISLIYIGSVGISSGGPAIPSITTVNYTSNVTLPPPIIDVGLLSGINLQTWYDKTIEFLRDSTNAWLVLLVFAGLIIILIIIFMIKIIRVK